jgi:hypothetical protein
MLAKVEVVAKRCWCWCWCWQCNHPLLLANQVLLHVLVLVLVLVPVLRERVRLRSPVEWPVHLKGLCLGQSFSVTT